MSAIVEPGNAFDDRSGFAGTANPSTVASRSAVSWGAVFAGAAGAAALSLILLLLGTGLGLSSVSPWASEGVDASTFGISTILWITFMQLAASAMGGYLAGRLRTKWVAVHTDEVYFRDTAHGFLAWAVATLGTAALLSSVIGAILGAGVQAGATAVGGAASAAVSGATVAGAQADPKQNEADGPMGYFVDSLFRASPEERRGDVPPEQTAAATAEVTRIFANAIRTGTLPDADVRYVGQVVAQRTDMSQEQAEQRVRDVFADVQKSLQDAEAAAREAADKAREASAYAALWLFISLLAGAFIASWVATYGGRQRDL
ncbi:MAG TPA: hypothetical protein VM692_09730 [Gammaproteobacteria bacterium]|nr:hypothetical protein [Gammaproteobacteria bacterium]